MKTLKIVFLTFLFFTFSTPFCFSQNIKKATKLLDKGDIEKFEETVSKAFEKDSLNPGIDFLYAKLYLLSSYPNNNIDQAKQYIRNASRKYKSAEEKVLYELKELEINKNAIDSLTNTIDSLAFDIALKKNSVDGFEYFIEKYPKAKYKKDAFDKRNAIVYESIKKLNTWRAYQYFIQSYKGAKQVKEAKDKYERLLYEEKTRDKTLGSYRLFLSQNKNTPFRDEIEKNILEISTESNNPDEYVNFLESFPKSKWYKSAINYLYYVSKKNINKYEKYFKNIGIYDSLNTIKKLDSIPLLGYYENEKYGFIDLNGNKIINPIYSSIKKEYLCEMILDDFLIINEEDEKVILNKASDTIYRGDFINAENLGNGIIKIIKKNEMELFHKSRKSIFSGQIDNAYIVYDKFILIEKNNKYELISFHGKKLIQLIFDDVMSEGSFIIFEKNGKYAVSNYNHLTKIIRNKKDKLKFIFDDYELIDKKALICLSKDGEELLDENLNIIIKKSKQNIYPIDKGWIVKSDSGYQIYSHIFDFKFSTQFDMIQNNKKYISGKKNDKWEVYSLFNGEKILEDYDSIKLVTDSVIWIRNQNEVKLYFSNKKEILIDTSSVLNILRANQNLNHSTNYIRVSDYKEANIYSETGYKLPKMEFFHVVKKGDTFSKISSLYKIKQSEILSMNNKKNTNLLIGEKLKIKGYTPKKLITDGFFEIEEEGKKGLVDKSGKLILEKIYDGIRLIDSSNISILKNEKFGVYNIPNNQLIEPIYFNELIPYDSTKYIAKDFFKYGIVNYNSDILLPFEYQSIEYWNQNSAIVKKDDKYSITEIETKKEEYSNIEKIIKIIENDEKMIKIQTFNGDGIISNNGVEILSPNYNQIKVVENIKPPFFIAKQILNEANLLVNLYVDSKGKIIKNQALKIDEKNKIDCN